MQLYGPEADKHLFRCLISYVDFSPDGRNSGKDGQVQLLTQEANSLVSKPNFSSLLCYAFERQENKVIGLRCVQVSVFLLASWLSFVNECNFLCWSFLSVV